MDEMNMKVIARARNDYTEKFGVPRQSGLVPEVQTLIVFEPEYRNPDALRGIEGFSHLWLIWGFSKAERSKWSPTVRPPRLGGNARMGVFATRSPYRPNSIGLSAVKLMGVEKHPEYGDVLRVSGADMMDGTPIYDVKPYLAYADCIKDASGGFTDGLDGRNVSLVFPEELKMRVPEDKLEALEGVLRHDPRPTYQSDPDRVYGMSFGGVNVKFTVSDGVLTVRDVERADTE